MSELTERLRKMAGIETSALYSQRKYLNEAADTLEAQEARIKTLEAALQEIESMPPVSGHEEAWRRQQEGRLNEQCRSIASKALTPSLPK